MGRKRGQITVFMIIGIIALFSVGIFLYMRSVKVEAPITYRPTVEQIPVEAEPIREFVQSCLREVAENGLRRIGDLGGYISAEEMGGSYNPAFPTQGDAVQFSDGSDLIIPYWWYMKGTQNCEKTGTCVFASKRPNLYRAEGEPSIEGQLDKYVNENMQTCLRDFVALGEIGFAISEEGAIETKTIITERSVAFEMTYPLFAEKAGVTYSLNKYFVDIPLTLKKIYELATTLTNLEIETNYLERYATRLTGFYMDLRKDALPPVSGASFESTPIVWSKSKVKERVKNLLVSYMPMYQIFGTRNYEPIDFPEGIRGRNAKLTIYNNLMLVPLMNRSHYSPYLDVRLIYLDWWEPYFNLNCAGEICGPIETDGFFEMLGAIFMKRYQFNYDYSFPVLVNIENSYAFFGKGYSFKFFLEANVRDNLPLREGFEGPVLYTPLEIPSGSLLCNDNQRTSPNITVNVADTLTGEGIPDVLIGYSCGTETCKIGNTDNDGKLTAKYPRCINGILQVKKDGYLGSGGVLSTVRVPDVANIDIQLSPYMLTDIEVKKYKVRKMCAGSACSWVPQPTSLSLSREEDAIVTLTRHAGPGEDSFATAAEYTGDRTQDDSSRNVSIVPGIYDVEITLLYKGGFIIPEREECVPMEILEIEYDEECYIIEEMEFKKNQAMSTGGASLVNVRIPGLSLLNSDKIVFHAVSIDIPGTSESARRHEDMEELNNVNVYAAMYGDKMLPLFEKGYWEAQREAATRALTE